MSSLDNLISSPYVPYIFALVMALPVIMLLRQFVHAYISMKNQELKLLTIKGNSENKSQAYERMALYLERIKPANLVAKFDKTLAPHEFIYLAEKTITEEFDYNSSQQLYITKTSWQNIVTCKNEAIALLRESLEALSSTATLDEFKTVFLMKYMNGDDFIGKTIEDLRREVLMVT